MTPEMGRWYYVSFGAGAEIGQCIAIGENRYVFRIRLYREWITLERKPDDVIAQMAEADIPRPAPPSPSLLCRFFVYIFGG